MSRTPVKILQLSDTHIYSDLKTELLGVKTYESFKATIEYILQNEKNYEFIIHTGDMTQDGSEKSYLRLAKDLSVLNKPVYYVPGNHDNPAALVKTYPLHNMTETRHIITEEWQFILLDSQISGNVEGRLSQAQLQFMASCLTRYPDYPAIIVFHHQPVPVGSEWLDNLGVQNADEFWSFVANYPIVHTILFGHVHQEYSGKRQGINLLSTPSTCIQFKRQQNHFGLEKLPPGYRVIYLYEDGRLESEVKRIDKYIGTFDEGATGY